MKKKVLVAMSGGVDSSVSAYLLKKSGFKVTGVTMCFGIKDTKRKKPACCGSQAIEDAKKVCKRLGISHYVMDFSKYLEKEVIDRFISEHTNGRTPNPCVLCNRDLKFGILLKKALSLGFDFLATGHYAKIEKTFFISGKRKSNCYILKMAKDRKKDQSYFLYPIKKSALKSILFPLGEFAKDEVRDIAKRIKLPVAEKPESQDICFIPEGNYYGFLSERIGEIRQGPILTLEGRLLGTHKGACFYTLGQRSGLGIGYRHPLYVLATDTKRNEVIVGERKNLKAKGLIATEVNILVDRLPRKAYAMIRYNQNEEACTVFLRNNRKQLEVIFKEPQEAITPGQSVVLYERDTILGGGVIDKVIQ